MNEHRRWLCRECLREWIEPRDCYANSSPVSITGNPINGSNCPICGSPEIQLVEYKPQYPGLDIPRDKSDQIKVIPTQSYLVSPGMTASSAEIMKIESGLAEPFNPWMGDRRAEELIIPPIMVQELRKKRSEASPEFD